MGAKMAAILDFIKKEKNYQKTAESEFFAH